MRLKELRYEREEETLEEQREAGRYNPGDVIVYRDANGRQRVPISAGTRDAVSVFQDRDMPNEVYILSTNWGLEYAGLEIFRSDDEMSAEQVGEMFISGPEQVKEVLGPKGLDYTERTMITRMQEYIY